MSKQMAPRRSPNHSGVRVIVTKLMCFAMCLGSMYLLAPSRVLPASADVISNYEGFDGCQYNGVSYKQPTVAQMQVWWTKSPFWQYYMYVGGINALCGGSASGISGSWIASVRTQGWGLAGIWVGPQCCGSPPNYISTNTTTARSQGVSEAKSAINQLFAWNQVNGNFPLVYDFESVSNTAAVNAFIGGWVQQLHSEGFPWAGGYGAVCGSQVSSWWSASPRPDFVWTADYQSPARATVWGLQCLSNSIWNVDQRHNQYRGTHSRSFGGVTLSIDTSCANGQVWGGVTVSVYGDPDSAGEKAGAAEDDAYYCGPVQ